MIISCIFFFFMHMGTQEACQQKLTGAPVFEYLYSTK